MKTIVLILALLALIKIGYQEYVVRLVSNEVIVAAYRERAITTCLKDAKNLSSALQGALSRPANVKLVIGKSDLDVHFWQMDHALWNAKFRNPYLYVEADGAPQSLSCEFDIVNGSASVSRM